MPGPPVVADDPLLHLRAAHPLRGFPFPLPLARFWGRARVLALLVLAPFPFLSCLRFRRVVFFPSPLPSPSPPRPLLVVCILHLSLVSRLGKHGLLARNPPGPAWPVPWCVTLRPPPAGRREGDAPRYGLGG